MTTATYPESMAYEQWERDGVKFALVKTSLGHPCGYCRFPKRPVKESSYDGILEFVPVHGGITYAGEDENGMVYGFDCAHFSSPQDPSAEWLHEQCELMARGISLASTYEDQYLLVEGDYEKELQVRDEYAKAIGAKPEEREGPAELLLNLAYVLGKL